MSRTPWDGAPRPPRRWQREALPALFAALRRNERPVVHAVMGSGKSIALAEVVWLALGKLEGDERIVVSTPTRALVEQLAATIEERCPGAVGRFYTHDKDASAQVVVCCNASMLELARRWDTAGVRCRVWVADEVHKTESADVKGAVALLNPARAVGWTGTPFRSEVGETLSLWDSLAYSYPLEAALADGVLVPWDQPTVWDGKGHKAEEVDAICLDMILQHAPPGPGIVSSQSIEDAEQVAEALQAGGVAAEAIHSRMPRARQRALLADLRAGRLRCLVHVALLAEGVDFPWLRWMCLRRKVRARVRFVQEVGRVLRAEPIALCPDGLAPKTKAVFLDPFNLFEQHGLAHPAALGLALSCALPDEEEEEDEWPLLALPPKGLEVPTAVAVDATGAWARRLVSVLEVGGVFKRDPRWGQNAPWRRDRVTPKQGDTLRKLAWVRRHFPAEHRPALAKVCASPGRLRQGIASDLISALMAVADASKDARQPPYRPWPWPALLDLPVLPDRVTESLVAGDTHGNALPLRRPGGPA